jgi:predicted nucleic acid-binding protein
VRACARYGSDYADRAREGLSMVSLLPVDDAVLGLAGDLRPSGLRSLDAIHLATAISLGDDLGAVLAYDERLREAGLAHGLAVLDPR